MMQELNPPDDAIAKSLLHRRLIDLEQCPILYTTNYDFYVERAFRLAGIPVEVIATEEDMAFGSTARQVVKFHGDFNNPLEMVMAEGDYYRRMHLDGTMDLKLRADIFGRAVLFVGYSFNDINIAYLFQTVNEMFKRLPSSFSGKRAYIIVHNPSDFETRLFHARNIEVIAAYGSDRTTAIAEILADMAS